MHGIVRNCRNYERNEFESNFSFCFRLESWLGTVGLLVSLSFQFWFSDFSTRKQKQTFAFSTWEKETDISNVCFFFLISPKCLVFFPTSQMSVFFFSLPKMYVVEANVGKCCWTFFRKMVYLVECCHWWNGRVDGDQPTTDINMKLGYFVVRDCYISEFYCQ